MQQPPIGVRVLHGTHTEPAAESNLDSSRCHPRSNHVERLPPARFLLSGTGQGLLRMPRLPRLVRTLKVGDDKTGGVALRSVGSAEPHSGGPVGPDAARRGVLPMPRLTSRGSVNIKEGGPLATFFVPVEAFRENLSLAG